VERIIRVKTTATAHVGCVSNQACLALDDITFSTIEEEGIAAELVLSDGIQREFDRTDLDFTVDFNGFIRSLYLAAIKFNINILLFSGKERS